MTSLPAILIAIESLEAHNAKDELPSLTVRYVNFENRLSMWQQAVFTQYCGRPYWTKPSMPNDQKCGVNRDDALQEYIQFADLSIAHLQLFNWTALLLLKTLLLTKRQLLVNALNVSDMTGTLMHRINANHCHELACKIGQSVEYFTQAQSGLVGIGLLGFPMTVAQGCLQILRSKDLVWFHPIYRKFETMDVQLQGFLDDMSSLRTLSRHIRRSSTFTMAESTFEWEAQWRAHTGQIVRVEGDFGHTFGDRQQEL